MVNQCRIHPIKPSNQDLCAFVKNECFIKEVICVYDQICRYCKC